MKPELTKELKERFYAQYIGSGIESPMGIHVNTSWDLPMNAESNYPLLLRPISSITYEEALELCQILDPEIDFSEMEAIRDYNNQLGVSFTDIDFEAAENQIAPVRISFASQYLQSKGFAVPFMGHSVEELISAGWVKLTTETKEKQWDTLS